MQLDHTFGLFHKFFSLVFAYFILFYVLKKVNVGMYQTKCLDLPNSYKNRAFFSLLENIHCIVFEEEAC